MVKNEQFFLDLEKKRATINVTCQIKEKKVKL